MWNGYWTKPTDYLDVVSFLPVVLNVDLAVILGRSNIKKMKCLFLENILIVFYVCFYLHV